MGGIGCCAGRGRCPIAVEYEAKVTIVKSRLLTNVARPKMVSVEAMRIV